MSLADLEKRLRMFLPGFMASGFNESNFEILDAARNWWTQRAQENKCPLLDGFRDIFQKWTRLSSIQNGFAEFANPSPGRWVLDSRCFSMIGIYLTREAGTY